MAASNETSAVILNDGSLDWSLGVNAIKATTIASELAPNGLARNELSWLDNATVRNGGIAQRSGITFTGTLPTLGYYQGSHPYAPDSGNPYFIAVINGHVWRIDPDAPGGATDLSAAFGLVLPVTERCFFAQAECFLIIQAGDGTTLPLFWDNTTLRQSTGITDGAVAPGTPGVNEIPAATSMIYYMGRLWYAQNRVASAGDIVLGNSGTLAYGFRDSVLNVTENPLCAGGDGFAVPSQAGNIRGLAYAANLNTQLGQGILYIGTREEIYQLDVPVTRTQWIAANENNQPRMTVAAMGTGWVSDRSIVQVNSDLFFQTLEPSIRSLAVAIRNFGQWGNVPLSINENRVMQYNDRALLRFSSGIAFDNRLLQTALPYLTPAGVAHKAIIPLNFDIISSFQQQIMASTGNTNSFPAWEGMWEGLHVLQLLSVDFSGLKRAFAIVYSEESEAIQWWEFTTNGKYDKVDSRVVWYFETPAYTFQREWEMKKLVSAELWFDLLWGEAIIKVEYRPDGYVCWIPWHEWTVCTEADPIPTPQYPEGINRASYRQVVSLPTPSADCTSPMFRPSNIGFQFQLRVTVLGYLRFRGIMLKAERVDRKLWEHMVC